MKLIAFDLETTGLDPERDRILEFCFIELDADLREQGRWSKLVDPGIPVPQEATEIHGITDDMVRGQAPFATHAGRIQRLVQDSILIAHNHRFDLAFLHHELVRAGQPGLPADHPCIDTLQIERYVNSHRLDACYRRYTGRELDGAHRSEADTAAMVEVLRGQMRQYADVLPDIGGLVTERLAHHFEPDRPRRTWLDHGRRFYRGPDGTVYFGFGKHRDAPATDHTDYLLWMRDRDFPDDAKAVIEKLLGPEFQPSAKGAGPA